jgi:transcriptional regulator with XRE-family HTH domain
VSAGTGGGTGRRERLGERRKALGLTQEALAELLDVDRSTVARWERGEASPLPWMRPRLARVLQISADRLEELLTGSRGGPGTGSAIPGGTGANAADAGDGTPGAAGLAEQRLGKASRDLAAAASRQWTAESVMRSLGRPEPIDLGWIVTRRAAAVAPTAERDFPADDRVPPVPHGRLHDLITLFRQLPKRQLVVLGEPGAGKTAFAVLLTLALLGDLNPGDPVPVLLPVSSWDPRGEHLYDWLARTLADEYPGLGNAAAYGSRAAQRLVAGGHVMPVLDGLDEKPAELHAAAIDAIDLATAGGRPFVLTCRGAEYERAVLRGGAILASAAVVEMQPVGVEEAARFLTAREPAGQPRWQPVIEHMRTCPRGALAQAMSTPLMVDLARAAYDGPVAEPAGLADAAGFPDSASIEEHLLDALLPAAYPRQVSQLSAAGGIRLAVLLPYEPEQASRWLTFLARHLLSARTRDLEWWQLAAGIPPVTRGLIFTLPPAVMFSVTGELAGGLRMALVAGLAFGLAGFAANATGRRHEPQRAEMRFRGTAARFLRRSAIGLIIAIALVLGWSLGRSVVLVLCPVFALATGAHVWLDAPAEAGRVSSPVTVLRQDRAATLAYALSFAVSLGTFFALADMSGDKIHYAPVLGGSFDIVQALATGIAGGLAGRFAFGRTGSVAYGLAAAVAGGQVIMHSGGLVHGLLTGSTFGIALGLTILLSRAWGSFILTRAWLAIRRRTPLRLMRFLADAHQRSVLRQVGAVYQFRHARLQDSLANPLKGRTHRVPATGPCGRGSGPRVSRLPVTRRGA